MSCKKNWVKIIDGNKIINVTDKEGLEFISYEIPTVNPKNEKIEIKGTDGYIPSVINFDSFPLNLTFRYTGYDSIDVNLYTQSIRSIFNRRNPYYIVHSKLPGLKYAVDTAQISFERETIRHYKINVEFNCYKGFSESVNTTDDEFLFESNWMFDNGIPLDFTPKYQHETNQFTIWNGSTDTIDPRNIHHQLQILLNVNATNGFELVNYTTGDVFKYNKSISSNIDFVLSGIHAYRDQNKVGIDTNRGVITLA
ncbi:phage tail family protein, partial [Staphylococcus schleiferi]|nr:phage tail family protein [Staphylococcus schleiferi]